MKRNDTYVCVHTITFGLIYLSSLIFYILKFIYTYLFFYFFSTYIQIQVRSLEICLYIQMFLVLISSYFLCIFTDPHYMRHMDFLYLSPFTLKGLRFPFSFRLLTSTRYLLPSSDFQKLEMDPRAIPKVANKVDRDYERETKIHMK